MLHADDRLTTRRLTLRRFTPDDLDLLQRLHADARVMRYTGGTRTRHEAAVLVRERILDYYDQHPGLGIWATVENSGGACVGLHLLNHIRGEAFIQLGYMLFPDYWGSGYATEMGIEVLRYGFVDLGLAQIVGITDLSNEASQRVLLKAGLKRNGERSFAHPAYAAQGPLAWFERDAADWLLEHQDL
ncbi:MAG TPA: GNAT family N-acetyltransferase [Rhodanobacteraceae bacterium]|nr:GNAT family N-acetyltransferase [Rhodanobacteraceae bacterium]